MIQKKWEYQKGNIFLLIFIVGFLLISLDSLDTLFHNHYRGKEGFFVPKWDGRFWNFISRNNNNKKVPIDLNTEGAILGEMNHMQLLPSLYANDLQAQSFKRNMLAVQTLPPSPPPQAVNTYMNPQNPFAQTGNAFKNAFSKPQNPFAQIVNPQNPFVKPNPFAQQQNTWNSLFHK